MKNNFLFCILIFLINFNALALEWHRGILQVDYMDQDIKTIIYGHSDEVTDVREFPYKTKDLQSFSSSKKNSIIFKLSTGIISEWSGPGSFSVDRYEHSWKDFNKKINIENSLSRSLIYHNSGNLIIDSKTLGEESLISIETPLGKIDSETGFFSINIENTQDSFKKNLTISCYKGELEFYSMKGDHIIIGKGDKIKVISKGEFFKVEPLIMDASDFGVFDKFQRRLKGYIDSSPYPYPKIEWEHIDRIGTNNLESNNKLSKDLKIQNFYMPYLKPDKVFNDYR